MNLHHHLFNEAFRDPKEARGLSGLSKEEKANMDHAMTYYRKHFKNRELVSDKELRAIKAQLSLREQELQGPAISSEMRSVLESVRPVYEKYLWPQHDQSNKSWIADAQKTLEKYGMKVRKSLEAKYKRSFAGPYLIDVTNETDWAGAYSTQGHVVIASNFARNKGLNNIELVFHEVSHSGPFEKIENALDKELERQKIKDQEKFWHAIQFYTVGETVREILADDGIEYTQYAVKYGLFDSKRSWGKFLKPLEEQWKPYLQGKVSLEDAVQDLVAAAFPMPDL